MIIETKLDQFEEFFIVRDGKVIKCKVNRIKAETEYDARENRHYVSILYRCVEFHKGVGSIVFLKDFDMFEKDLEKLCVSKTVEEAKLKAIEQIMND